MSGRLDKIVSMFNALDDEDKNYVLTEIVYPEVPEIETPYEVENASFQGRHVPDDPSDPFVVEEPEL